MRLRSLIPVSLVFTLSVPALSSRAQTTEPFTFRVSFWNNLHHFLYVLGRAQNHAPDASRRAVADVPVELKALDNRPEAEQQDWQNAVAFYAAGPSKLDSVFDSALIKATSSLAAAPDDADLSGLGLDPDLVAALRRAAPIYRHVWWTAHRRADEECRDSLQGLIRQHGERLVKRLTDVYQTSWPAEPRRIDLVAYANWAGAYSTDGGLIVVASTDVGNCGTPGLETLLHESSHQWDDEIHRRLARLADAGKLRVPDALSHALIFYTSGEIVKELFPSHTPYAIQAGLWKHSSLAPVKPVLDEYWQPYLHGSGTLDAALAAILAHLQ